MKHYGLEIPEDGIGVLNLTVPTGTTFPINENAGEMFFRTDQNVLYVHGTIPGGSPFAWIDLVNAHFPLLAPDGTETEPSYSWRNETNTGLHRPDVGTVAHSVRGEDMWRLVKTGGSPTAGGGSPDPVGDAGIDLHIKNDGNGDSQLRLETDAAGKDATFQLITATGTWKISNESATDFLTYQLDGVEVFRLETDGSLASPSGALTVPGGSPGYETFVVDDDDIPNKKYVDDAILPETFNGSPPTFTKVTWISESGSPEGVVAAPVGSLYSNTTPSGSPLNVLYVKQTGAGNTGWVLK